VQFAIVATQSHRLKSRTKLSAIVSTFGGAYMTRDMAKTMDDMTVMFNNFKETVIKPFRNIEVDVKEWNLNIQKGKDECIYDMNAKLIFRQKVAAEHHH
jgi:hypothetical protein